MKRLQLPLTNTLLLGVGMAWAGPKEDLFGANAAYDRGDYATALETFRLLAAPGIVEAQESLGTMYESWRGVAQDYAEAFKWYRLAVAQGDRVGRERFLREAHRPLTTMGAKGHAVRLARELAR